jgi:hypothetical protein
MKFFVAFIVISFAVAAIFPARDIKKHVWFLCGLVLFVTIGYFFFNQI